MQRNAEIVGHELLLLVHYSSCGHHQEDHLSNHNEEFKLIPFSPFVLNPKSKASLIFMSQGTIATATQFKF